MAKYTRFINDEQWKKILIPQPKTGRVGRPCIDSREVLEGFAKAMLECVYVLAQIKLLEEDGIWLKAWHKFFGDLDEQALLDWEKAFIDGNFAPAKKGVSGLEKPKGAIERNPKFRMLESSGDEAEG